MLSLKIWIIPHSLIGIAYPCSLKIWNVLQLSIYDLFHISTLGNPFPSHLWIAMCILTHWLFWAFCNVWVPLFWAVPVVVEPFRMVSGRVSAPPELHRVIAITRCLPCGLLGHTHTRGYGIPVGIIWVSQAGKWKLFLILPVRGITIIKYSSRGH